MRRAAVAVISGLLMLGASVPARAVFPTDSLVISGAAGSRVVMTLRRPVTLDRSPSVRLKMGRGAYAGVTLVRLGADPVSWYARYRFTPAFARGDVRGCFASAQYEDIVTSADQRASGGPVAYQPVSGGAAMTASRGAMPPVGDQGPSELRLPAGRYAVTLIGETGQPVSVRLVARGLGREQQVRAVMGGRASTTELPVRHAEDGSHELATAYDTRRQPSRSFEGMLVGLGYGKVSLVNFDGCLGPDPRPATAGCSGDGQSFNSNPGDSGLSYQAAFNVIGEAGSTVIGRTTYAALGSGSGLRAIRYSIRLPQ